MKRLLILSLVLAAAALSAKEEYVIAKGAITYEKKTAINGETKTENTEVFYIFGAKDIDGDKVPELLCAFKTGEMGLAFLNTDLKSVKRFIPIGTKEAPMNDMCFGDIFNDRTTAIAAIGGDYLYIYRFKNGALECAETRNLYTKNDYGLDADKKDAVQLKKNGAIQGVQVTVGDIDTDFKNEVVLAKTDTWKKLGYPSCIIQALRWDGKTFKSVYYKGGNEGLGNETWMYIEDVNFDMQNELVFDGRIYRYKVGEATLQLNGPFSAGRLADKRIMAAALLDKVKDKSGNVTGYSKDMFVIRAYPLSKQTFGELTDKKLLAAGLVYRSEQFEEGGKYPFTFESDAIEKVARFVFCDIDGDGKNELIIDTEGGFFVMRENK